MAKGKLYGRKCVCGQQELCQGVSAGFRVCRDARSGYAKLPKFYTKPRGPEQVESNLRRQAYLRHLQAETTGELQMQSRDIALHHFHPSIVLRAAYILNNSPTPETRQRARDLIPKTITEKEMVRLGLNLDKNDRVLNQGKPTGEYFFVPTYSVKRAKKDLTKLVRAKRPTEAHGPQRIRNLYLSCLGGIFVVAFWSYYTSFPGLISTSGIEPVNRLMPYASPWLYHRFIYSEIIDEDSFFELAAVLGMLLSCLIASGIVQHGLLFGAVTAIYSVLTMSGGTFYSFQWDTLLLETGTVTALCYAPWTSLRPSADAMSLGVWPLRFLLLKLMFMSGIVKIQANCPTWNNLTALEYHFATQCLPGPLAWHFHQLHPLFLRLSVAATLWIEMPLAFLLLAPWSKIRRMAAKWQILLQIMILLTGNYNFFNLLTIVLCLPCWEEDESSRLERIIPRKVKEIWKWAEPVVLWGASAWSLQKMFIWDNIASGWRDASISLRLTKADCEELSDWAIPCMVLATAACIFWNAVGSCITRRQSILRTMTTFANCLFCVLVVGVLAVPLCSLTPALKKTGYIGSDKVFIPLWRQYAMPYRLVNGYGLFRRMTGVGHPPSSAGGWAGQPPSVVERPEIIFEGAFTGNETEQNLWYQLSFRWKPGNIRNWPRQVAPHQPRLDWQMWFAALGNSEGNLWFLNLVQKLLDDCSPVKHLLGDPKLTRSRRKLIKLRAKLYHYDFTRIKSEWNIPGAALINATTDANSLLTPWVQAFGSRPDRVWHRKAVRPYLRPIELGDQELEKHLANYGYDRTCFQGPKDRCRGGRNAWCRVAVLIREFDLHLIPLGFLVFYVLLRVRRLFRASHADT